MMCTLFIFFFKQKTAYEMLISDWIQTCALPILLFLPLMASAIAKVTADEAARLGKELTPLGAERAGNAAGTIPAWTGGLPKQDLPRGANPFAADKPLYTITAQNMAPHAAVLTERSEESRVGEECGRTCRSLWWPHH